MKKLALIDENGNLQVGLGTDEAFYRSLGMEEMDVEQGWDGNWYLSGQAPEKPAELIRAEEIAELKAKLATSDYAVIKIAEGAATAEEYSELINERQQWRARINELEAANE